MCVGTTIWESTVLEELMTIIFLYINGIKEYVTYTV